MSLSEIALRRAVFGIGSNLGDRLAMLRGAVRAIAESPGITLAGVSPVFETDPVGGPEQPDFLNAVVVADTALSPRELLEICLDTERRYGRLRLERWGPRTLDIDLIAVGDLTLNEPDLTLPHPSVADRAFVLVPWSRADPSAMLPGAVAVRDLAARIETAGMRERSDLAIDPPTAPDPLPPGVGPT